MESEGRDEGTTETMLVGRGKMPERGLRDLVPGGREVGRVELASKPELRASLVVEGVGLDVTAGRSEGRGASVVCTTPWTTTRVPGGGKGRGLAFVGWLDDCDMGRSVGADGGESRGRSKSRTTGEGGGLKGGSVGEMMAWSSSI